MLKINRTTAVEVSYYGRLIIILQLLYDTSTAVVRLDFSGVGIGS